MSAPFHSKADSKKPPITQEARSRLIFTAKNENKETHVLMIQMKPLCPRTAVFHRKKQSSGKGFSTAIQKHAPI